MAITLQQLPEKVNIKLYKGDDWPLEMKRWTDTTKTTLVDLSGYSAELRIADADTGALLDSLSTVGGEIILLDGTGTYNIAINFLKALVAGFTWTSAVYDFALTDSLGLTRTLFKGTISIQQDA